MNLRFDEKELIVSSSIPDVREQKTYQIQKNLKLPYLMHPSKHIFKLRFLQFDIRKYRLFIFCSKNRIKFLKDLKNPIVI